jgi:hypothetical protein
MRQERYITAQQAVELKLIDRVQEAGGL